jgi:filamentous hemagglutinin family protein
VAAPSRPRLRGRSPLFVFVAAAALALPAHADIATDGSTGPARVLAGPDHEIPAALGAQSGGNLFHSFERFGLAAGESATFTDAGAAGVIERVLSRVTGGEPSEIDGVLRSTIPGADVYFLNPAGVVFGPGARTDVPASLHVSTADAVEFPNGERFEARPGGDVPRMAVAPPEAFGFLSAQPAGIAIDHSRLSVREGEGLALVGGDLEVQGRPFGGSTREIVAPAGRLDLVSVGSAGRVSFPDAVDAPPVLEGFSALGDVTFEGGWASTRGTTGAGRVFLRGGEIVLEQAAVESDSRTVHDAGSVDVEADSLRVVDSLVGAFATSLSTGNGGTVRVRAREVSVEAVDALSRIETSTAGPGRAGTIDIAAEEVRLRSEGGGGRFDAVISAASTGTGDAGSIALRARAVHLEDGGFVGAAAFGTGPARAGDIRIEAEEVSLVRSALDAGSFSERGAGSIAIEADRVAFSDAGLFAHSFGSGSSGQIAIDAGEIRLDATTEVTVNAYGPGDAGTIDVRAREVHLQDDSAFAAASFFDGSPSRGGDIRVEAERLTLDGARLDAGRVGEGGAGSIAIDAGRVELGHAVLFAHAYGAGDAGRIAIDAGELRIDGASELSVNGIGTGVGGLLEIRAGTLEVLEGSVLFAENFGPGDAGAIEIDAGSVEVAGSQLRASSRDGGDAGRVEISATRIRLLDGAEVRARAVAEGDAGSVALHATESITIAGSDTDVDASSRVRGDAGRIVISAPDVLLDDHALVSSAVVGLGGGRGGSIRIAGDHIVIRGGALVSTSALSGGTGSIAIEAGESLFISNRGGDPLSLERLLDLGVPGPSGVYAATLFGTGERGAVTITAPLVEIVDGGIVATTTLGPSDAGPITIRAGRVAVLDGGLVDSSSAGAGAAGATRIEASDSIRVAGAGADGVPSRVRSAATAGGAGGDIALVAPEVLLEGGALATTTVGADATGAGGSIAVEAERLRLAGGGRIDTSSFSSGDGGRVRVGARELLQIEGEGSGIFAETGGAGVGGGLEIEAGALRLADGGVLSTRSGSGLTGAAIVFTDAVAGGFVPELRTPPGATPGPAGDVSVTASRLALAGGTLDTEADRGAGGNIFVHVTGPVALERSTISASVGSGSGGNVTLEAPLVRLDASRLVARAEEGSGGNVAVRTTFLLASPDSEISASARLGVDGRVAVEAPDIDLAAALATLPETPLEAEHLLRERCARVPSEAIGSFVVAGRAAVPASHSEALLLALVPTPSRGIEAAEGPPAAALAAAGAALAPHAACARASY